MSRFTKLLSLSILLLGCVSMVNAESSKNVPAIQDFINSASIEPGSISMSPKGDFFAVIVPRSDRSDLIIFDRATMKPSANITSRKHEYISNYWWVSDRRIIATFAVKEGSFETPAATGELWGVDADGKNGKYLFGYRGNQATGTHIAQATQEYASATVLEPNADERENILIGTTQWSAGEVPFMVLARLNIKNGSLIKTGGRLPIRYVGNVVTDHAGKVRLVSGTTADQHSQLFFLNDDSREWVKINDSQQSARVVVPLAYSEDNQQVYARVSDSKNPDYLVLLNPATKTEKIIYKPKEADIGQLMPTADKKDAYAIETFDGRGGYVFLKSDSSEALLTKEMMKQFPGELVIANSFSRDGKFATLMVTSDVNPGEYYLFDKENKKMSLVLKSRAKIEVNESAVVEPIELKARDGLTLHGWFTQPKNTKAKVPLVVFPHGGPYGVVDRWGYNEEVQLLASRGYAVLQVNFRGSGGYGKAFVDAGVGEWGQKMQSDITDATKWIIGQGKVDSSKICIYGASYGAYAALMAVATEPTLFKCAIGYSGVYDLGIFQSRGDIDNTAYGRGYLNYVMQKDKDWIMKYSPTYLADQIKAPVLLIHGGADRRTPPAHANAMRAALIKAGKPPEWIYKSDEGHGFFDDKNRLEAYQTVLDFLDKNIAP